MAGVERNAKELRGGGVRGMVDGCDAGDAHRSVALFAKPGCRETVLHPITIVLLCCGKHSINSVILSVLLTVLVLHHNNQLLILLQIVQQYYTPRV